MFSPRFDLSFMLYNSHSAARSIYLWRDTVASCNNQPYFLWAEKRSNPTCSLYLCETCNQLLHSIWKLPFSSYCNYCCPFTGHKLGSIYSSTRIKLWPKPRQVSRTGDCLCAELLLGETEGVSLYALDGHPNYFSKRWGHIPHGPIMERGKLVINSLHTNKHAREKHSFSISP